MAKGFASASSTAVGTVSEINNVKWAYRESRTLALNFLGSIFLKLIKGPM